jgi:hypothetical protein
VSSGENRVVGDHKTALLGAARGVEAGREARGDTPRKRGFRRADDSAMTLAKIARAVEFFGGKLVIDWQMNSDTAPFLKRCLLSSLNGCTTIGTENSGESIMIYFIISVLIFVLQLQAYLQGMESYFQIGTLVSIIIGLVLMNLPLGFVAIAVITFYGAYFGWHWEAWKAVLLAAPGIVFSIVALAIGGLTTMFSAGRRGA